MVLGDKGLEIGSNDGNFKAAIGGRLQLDGQTNWNSHNLPNATGANTTNALADGTSLRRARLHAEGTFFKDYDYKFEYDFTRGPGTTAAGVTDAYIRWNALKPFALTVGQFKEPFSLEEATSNRFLTFIERNMRSTPSPTTPTPTVSAPWLLFRTALDGRRCVDVRIRRRFRLDL